MPPHRPAPRPTLPLALLLALAACGLPEDADVAPSDYVQASSRPELVPNATFSAATAEAVPASAALETGAAALAARAEALRSRAEALGPPVIDPAVRDRLESAAEPPSAP